MGKKTLYFIGFYLILAIVLISLACFLAKQQKDKELNKVVAKVYGKNITRKDLVQALDKADKGIALENLIEKELVYQKARKAGISVSTAELNRDLYAKEKQLTSVHETLENYLRARNMTKEDLKKEVEYENLSTKVILGKAVSEEVLSEYIQTHSKRFPEGPKDELTRAVASLELRAQEGGTYREFLKKGATIVKFPLF